MLPVSSSSAAAGHHGGNHVGDPARGPKAGRHARHGDGFLPWPPWKHAALQHDDDDARTSKVSLLSLNVHLAYRRKSDQKSDIRSELHSSRIRSARKRFFALQIFCMKDELRLSRNFCSFLGGPKNHAKPLPNLPP